LVSARIQFANETPVKSKQQRTPPVASIFGFNIERNATVPEHKVFAKMDKFCSIVGKATNLAATIPNMQIVIGVYLFSGRAVCPV